MRDLLFKNLTSSDRKKRIISSSEIVDKQGTRSIVHRHFACIVKEIQGEALEKPSPYLYVLKEHNTKKQKEKFFCRMKGSIYAVANGRLFLILFMHSLKIYLTSAPQDLMKRSE
ncbi:MAG: hypothetical protein PHT41_00015 [Candidatus Omnitrophica bacterium]|nr:hypothetical protein [Candidatus Omnitrophota bacterium]